MRKAQRRKAATTADRSGHTERPRAPVFADAGDDGFRFILPYSGESGGGLIRRDNGHLVAIVGRGGTGKSLFALQFVTALLDAADDKVTARESTPKGGKGPKPAAFYFTLEATPSEFAHQVRQFEWGDNRYKGKPPDTDAAEWECSGLYVQAIPSPAEDLAALNLHIRQTVARKLKNISELVAVVIDPLGGATLSGDLRNELCQLKSLADSHRTFLFLLVEDHIYEDHLSVEHFSQTVIHLEHDDQTQRRLYIQKARNQEFRSGYHQFDLVPDAGIRVFPSIEAQSAYSHHLLRTQDRGGARKSKGRTPSMRKRKEMIRTPDGGIITKVDRGAVIFLMGPPGTFKQLIATRFCDGPSIYISFKADDQSVVRNRGLLSRYLKAGEIRKWDWIDLQSLSRQPEEEQLDEKDVLFFDARNPLLTPEKVLGSILRAVTARKKEESSKDRRKTIAKRPSPFVPQRAVVWGLRRLKDMPNFTGSRGVEFLEALVTLLRSHKITTLLVDWPDIGEANPLPIIDLSHCILLTRVCKSYNQLLTPEKKDSEDKVSEEKAKALADSVWLDPDGKVADHVTLLRVQREASGFKRNVGFLFWRERGKDEPHAKRVNNNLERFWHLAGVDWKTDPGLG